MIPTAKARIRGPWLRDVYLLDFLSGRIINRNPPAREIDVAPFVQGHPVRTLLAEECFTGQNAACGYGIFEYFARTNVGHIQRFAVGRANDPVWLLQILDHGRGHSGSPHDVIDILRQLTRPPLPVFPFIKGVGEPYPAIRVHPEVIRAIELVTFVFGQHHLPGTIRPDLPYFIFLIGTGPEIPHPVKAKSVCPAAGLFEGAQLSIKPPFHDAVIWLVRKKDVPLGIAAGTLGEFEFPGQLLRRSTRFNDIACPNRIDDEDCAGRHQ